MSLKNILNFNLQTTDNLKDYKFLENYQGLIIHEDALKNKNFKDIIKNQKILIKLFFITQKN